MKKNLTLLLLIFASFVQAQFFEGFENGVPGSMKQSFDKTETTWTDFGISAVYVDNALTNKNSAVFFNGMALQEVSTSLETPALDLSKPNLYLEFKYLQNTRSEGYANTLYVELSNDFGITWDKLAVLKTTGEEATTYHINLSNLNATNQAMIRFRSVQHKLDMGYPIVLDDITITDKVMTTGRMANRKVTDISLANRDEIKIYPNPSSGMFVLTTTVPLEVTVTDINGKLLYNNTIEHSSTIDLSRFPSGVYFAQLQGENYNEIKKLVIK